MRVHGVHVHVYVCVCVLVCVYVFVFGDHVVQPTHGDPWSLG